MSIRAMRFTDLDPAYLDAAVCTLLDRYVPNTRWERIAMSAMVAPVVASSVDLGGFTAERVVVRVNSNDAVKLGRLLLGDETITAADLVAELANTLAGNMKFFLGDGLMTGLPEVYSVDPGAGRGYRSLFRSNDIIVEVSTHG